MKRSPISLTNTGAFANIILVNAAGTSVQLRQTVTTDGITVGIGNEHNANLFDVPTRTLEGLDSVRTVLLPCPTGYTAAQAQAKVDALAGTDACLYYRISDDVRDLLGANQLAGIAAGTNTKTIAQYEADMRVVNPKTGEDMGFYRATHFSMTAQADVDLRVRAKVAIAATAPAELAQTPVTAPAAAEKAPF